MNLIEIGEVVNTHGVHGEIKLNPWTDDLEALTKTVAFYLKDGESAVTLYADSVRIHKNCAIIKLENVDDMQTAETFRGRILYVKKEENLPEGRYYIADLIGLSVLTDDGELGTVTDVFQTGANDVYEVKRKGEKPAYLPAIKDVVKEINIKDGYMKVVIPEGLLED
ncbi:MAG: 16S rRNA processing protein RimM [Clostridia bacterium]|nr:16S rRNA processing protein RimM [Clostridia bacterium]